MVPAAIRKPLLDHLNRVKAQHESDLAAGRGTVALTWGFEGQVPERPSGMGLAVGVSRDALLHRPVDRRASPTSSARVRSPTRGQGCGPVGGHSASRYVPLAASFIRDPSAGSRVRHPHDSRTARASRRQYDDDLHARAQSRRARCTKSPRSTRSRSRAPVNPICRRSRKLAWRYRVLHIPPGPLGSLGDNSHRRWYFQAL
jgi:hypothetical protein